MNRSNKDNGFTTRILKLVCEGIQGQKLGNTISKEVSKESLEQEVQNFKNELRITSENVGNVRNKTRIKWRSFQIRFKTKAALRSDQNIRLCLQRFLLVVVFIFFIFIFVLSFRICLVCIRNSVSIRTQEVFFPLYAVLLLWFNPASC